jgi:hypothetical protein
MMLKVVVGALIVGAAIIAAAAFGRYEMTAGEGAIYRLDRLTGRVEMCMLYVPGMMVQSAVQPAWCEAARQRAQRRPRAA